MMETVKWLYGVALVGAVGGHLRSRLYVSGYALVVGSTISSVLGAGYWLVAAHIYPPNVIGNNSAVIAAMMFLSGVSQLNLASALVRFVPVAGNRTHTLVARTYVTAAVVALFVSMVFLTGLSWWAPQLGFLATNQPLRVTFVLATIGWCIFNMQDSVFMGLHRALWVPVDNILSGVAKMVLLVGLARLVPEFGVFASWTIALLLSVVPMNWVISRRLIPRYQDEASIPVQPFAFSQLLTYVPGDYLGAMSWLAATTLLPVMVAGVEDATATAHFVMAWQIAFWLHSISPNMGSSMIAESAPDGSRLKDYSLRMFRNTFSIVVLGAIAVVLAAPFLLGLFGASYALQGTLLLRLLSLAAIPNAITSFSVSVARSQRRIDIVVRVLLLQCLSALVASYVLLQSLGITGVGIAWLGSNAGVAALVLPFQLLPLWRAQSSSRERPEAGFNRPNQDNSRPGGYGPGSGPTEVDRPRESTTLAGGSA